MTKPWRSEGLTPAEHKAFKKWVAEQRTKEDAAKTIGISRNALYMISASGSGKPTSVEKIRKQIA